MVQFDGHGRIEIGRERGKNVFCSLNTTLTYLSFSFTILIMLCPASK
jgi:hypothetical protein